MQNNFKLHEHGESCKAQEHGQTIASVLNKNSFLTSEIYENVVQEKHRFNECNSSESFNATKQMMYEFWLFIISWDFIGKYSFKPAKYTKHKKMQTKD